jgi:hypothetical protein
MADRVARLEKDDDIMRMLAKLQQRLGVGAFQVVDHWEADLRAIGIADPLDEHRLAYIAAVDPAGNFYVELEDAPPVGSELPYSISGRYRDVNFDRLAELVAGHLRCAGPDTSS